MAVKLRRFAGPLVHARSLDHIRVAHLTDLHVGRVTPHAAQLEAVTLTNAQQPDLVVITGDFVCHSQMWLDQLRDVVSRIEAPVLTVLGNHDHWSGAEEVRVTLRRAGAEVLDNAWTKLNIRGQPLQVMGLDDSYTGHADRDKALKGLDPRVPSLGLSHIAEEADALWHYGIPLVLSGHTHAGQVTVARLNELVLGRVIGHRYVHGLYGSRDPDGALPGAVYVGAGIGSAVLPVRLGERARREVTVFELGKQPGAFDEHHAEQSPSRGRKPSAERRRKRIAQAQRKSQRRLQAARRKGIDPLADDERESSDPR